MSEWIQVKAEDGSLGAYVARPTVAKAPAVVVIQEIFGVNADLRATCDELASRGFVALSPDLFWRAAPRIDMNKLDEADWKRGFELYQSFDFDRGVRDIAATVAAARTLSGTSGKVGVMGFCMGGLLAFLTAARQNVDAAVEYYGGGTDQYVGEGKNLKSPLMVHLAEEDEFISKEAQAKIKSALAHNPLVEIHSYPGCNHAFARHKGVHYDAQAASRANGLTRAFFERNLRA
jgi:carboxymethylenebutenolidase